MLNETPGFTERRYAVRQVSELMRAAKREDSRAAFQKNGIMLEHAGMRSAHTYQQDEGKLKKETSKTPDGRKVENQLLVATFASPYELPSGQQCVKADISSEIDPRGACNYSICLYFANGEAEEIRYPDVLTNEDANNLLGHLGKIYLSEPPASTGTIEPPVTTKKPDLIIEETKNRKGCLLQALRVFTSAFSDE
ncbi:hypothetical protein KKC94_04695 [Patescibacteria group bacterium]|nr:hypothetical protein [Patescibacteria group bacterium]